MSLLEIEEMDLDEINDMISEENFAHLGCCKDNVPYVIPINYAFIEPYIYIYTTEGKKSEIIVANPHVCLQVEHIKSRAEWQSIVIDAFAHQVTDIEEREKAVAAILKINPTLTPAISVHWMDDWVRENIEVLFRIEPTAKTGRRTRPHVPKPRSP